MLNALQALDPRKDRLSPLDAAFLYLEGEEQLMHVGCVALLDGQVPFDAFVETQGRRLGQMPRYRQRPIRPPLDLVAPAWEDDPDFDPVHHIRHITLPAPGGEAELHRIVDDLFAAPFDPRHPLWETYLIDGYLHGQSAILSKVHHCMIDGVSGVQILEVMTDASPDTHALPPASQNGDGEAAAGAGVASAAPVATSALSRFGRAAAAAPAGALGLARGALEAASVLGAFARRPIPALPINGTLSSSRRIAWATFALDDFLAMRGAAGCKVNDVVLAVIAGALRSYLHDHGAAVDGLGVRALVPVNIRRAGEHLTLGNRVSAMFATLPLGIADPLDRLHAVARDTRGLKDRGQQEGFEFVVSAAGALPTSIGAPLTRLMGHWPVVHTVCTNVPGSRHPRYVLGCPVREIHPIVPLAIGIGLGFAIMSYDGTLSICATADAGLVPDADAITHALTRSADALRERLQAPAGHAPTPAATDAAPTIAAFMTHHVETLAPGDSLAWAWEIMRRHRIRHLPVVDAKRRLLGVVTHRDLLAVSESGLPSRSDSGRPLLRPSLHAEDVMETHASTATPTEAAADAGRRMVHHKIGCLPVVEPGGRLVGIVTEEDFMRWATEHMGSPQAVSEA